MRDDSLARMPVPLNSVARTHRRESDSHRLLAVSVCKQEGGGNPLINVQPLAMKRTFLSKL